MRQFSNDLTRVKPLILPAITFLIVFITLLIRIRFLDFPIERDEGEYALMGSLILQGIPPYAESYNMKMPGIYGIYALIMFLFGESVSGIKLGLILFVLASTFFVYLIGKHWFDQQGGLIAAGLYSLLSLLPTIQGMSANAEQFLLPFALGGTCLLLKNPDKALGIIVSGLLIGTAAMIKQHGILFAGFCGIFLLFLYQTDWKHKALNLMVFSAGCLVPVLIVFGIMAASGVFDTFWFWTVQYALTYASQLTPAEGWQLLSIRVSGLFAEAPGVLLLAIIGIFGLARRLTVHSWTPILFFLFSFLATAPGLYFRPHYFILLMPAICLFCAKGTLSLSAWSAARFQRSDTTLATAGVLALLLISVALPARPTLMLNPLDQVNRDVFGANPFVESPTIAEYISSRSSAEDRIAIVGSEPQIYFYANRRAATGYIYTYALMEEQPFSSQMQQEMIKEIESNDPLYLVYANVPNSWRVRPQSDRTIFSWYESYRAAHYQLVGLVELRQTGAIYYWDEALPDQVNPMTMGMFIYRRITPR